MHFGLRCTLIQDRMAELEGAEDFWGIGSSRMDWKSTYFDPKFLQVECAASEFLQVHVESHSVENGFRHMENVFSRVLPISQHKAFIERVCLLNGEEPMCWADVVSTILLPLLLLCREFWQDLDAAQKGVATIIALNGLVFLAMNSRSSKLLAFMVCTLFWHYWIIRSEIYSLSLYIACIAKWLRMPSSFLTAIFL